MPGFLEQMCHPDFMALDAPHFGMDYLQFVLGCHLGLFMGYYEHGDRLISNRRQSLVVGGETKAKMHAT